MNPYQCEYKPTASSIETRKSSKITKNVNSAINKCKKSIKIHATEHDTAYKLPALTTNHDTTKGTNCRAIRTIDCVYGRPRPKEFFTV